VSLDGRTAIVTGASSGIGRGIATELGEAGASVVVADQQEAPREGGDPTAAVITADGGTAVYHETDVTDGSAVEALVAATVEEFDGLDIVVNNVGISHDGTLEELPPDEWESVIDVNLTSAYRCTRHALPLLRESDGARVINVASQLGLVGVAERAAYCASKAGLIGFTKQIAVEYADVPITANAICPGVVRTALTEEIFEEPEARADIMDATLLPYVGEPEDIGRAARYLADESGRYITGQCLVVDGGYTAH